MEFAPYMDLMGYFETILDVSRLAYVDLIADFAKFKAHVWGSLIWT